MTTKQAGDSTSDQTTLCRSVIQEIVFIKHKMIT